MVDKQNCFSPISLCCRVLRWGLKMGCQSTITQLSFSDTPRCTQPILSASSPITHRVRPPSCNQPTVYCGSINKNANCCVLPAGYSRLQQNRMRHIVLLAFPGRGLCSSFCTVSRSSVFTACSSSWSFPIFRFEPLYSRSILRHSRASPRGGRVYRGHEQPPPVVSG